VFVTTGFLDGQLWMWWDRVQYVLAHAQRSSFSVQTAGGDSLIDLRARDDHSRDRFISHCKSVPEEEKNRLIERLASSAEVELPRQPPPAYAPMTWGALRHWESRGAQFGPHTVTHPILSKTSAEQSRTEIRASWECLAAQASRPLPIFCYPNGQWDDFGAREVENLQALGLEGAVVGAPGYASTREFGQGASSPFQIRRFSLPDNLLDLVQVTSGVEFLKSMVRAS
jgi:hypothetical protein